MSLTVVYGQEEPPAGFSKSIFLIGPSPRKAEVASWRPEAIALLDEMGYDGVVFVPEPRGDRKADLGPDGYLSRVDWEEESMNMADVIMCWLPRDLKTMPGFTTNVELGMWLDSGKMVFGGPQGAYKNRYIEHHAAKRKVPVAHTLRETVANALELLGEGAWRSGGEREVPLLVWRTPHFQRWYADRVAANEVLEHAKLVWTHRIGPDRRTVFFWVLHAEIYITTEDRRKSNEVVLSRPDISTIVLYHQGKDLNSTTLGLIGVSVVLITTVLFRLQPSDIQIPVRYTGFGLTFIYRDQWYVQYGYVALALIVVFLNGFLALKLYKVRRLLGLGLIGMSIFILTFATIVINAMFNLAPGL